VVVNDADGSPEPLVIFSAPKGFVVSVLVYDTTEPSETVEMERLTTTLFVPDVGLFRYQTELPLVDVAKDIATPAYVTPVIADELTLTMRSVEVALTVFWKVTELALVH
jgi:hypothetical protein